MNIQRGLALVVSNNRYQHCNPLPSCEKDGADIEKSLRSLGFDVISAQDFMRQDLFNVIGQFLDASDSYSTILLFYSGHGVQIDGENYIVPIDCNPIDNKTIMINTGLVPIHVITEYMNVNPQKTNIVILDACRTSPTFTKDIMQGGLAEIKSGQGTFVSFATAPNRVAIGSSLSSENSVFTGCLLKHIEKPNVKIEDLFKLVRNDVIVQSGGTQNPWESTSLIEDFYFNIMSQDRISEHIYKTIRNRGVASDLIHLSDYYQHTISDIYRIYHKQKSEKPGGIHFSNTAELEAYILHQILELGFEYKYYRWIYKDMPVAMGEFYHDPQVIALEPLPGASINVSFELNEADVSENGCVISGRTNLPTNTQLMIKLQNSNLQYSAQSKAHVQSGIFNSEQFTMNKAPLPSGDYKILISTPIASVQPKEVQLHVGVKGCNLMGPYVSTNIIDGKTVEFQKVITIKFEK
ncbi:MAG: caspase family protein [Desulfosporosinus sp.]|nr:caspase family protein [Desulfosporosinus sp.]